MPERGVLTGGVRLAFATLTVLPVRRPHRAPTATTATAESGPDRATAGVAMSVAPLVGAVLGLVLGGLALGAVAVGAAPLVTAVLVVAAGALLTRGLHLDGLADTVDGLGSYRDAAGALDIMRKPDIGPFGVVAIVLVLLAQVASLSVLVGRSWPAALAGIVAATAAGRVAIALGCQRGVPAARTGGLGAAVAGTVGATVLIVTAGAVGAIAIAAVPGRPWQGPLAVTGGLVAAVLVRRHATRRLGGITGDVLGALCEVAVTTTYVVASM